MRIKVGDVVYDPNDTPIMVILTDADKFNISHMAPEATKYAAFPSAMLTQEAEQWMAQEGRIRHTVEEDFQHFLSYSGYHRLDADTQEKLRIAFAAAWE